MAGIRREIENLDVVKQLATANTQFGFDLYKKVASERDSNLFLSPFSISTALAMTYLGARGDTASGMAHVLKWTDLKDQVHPGFQDYLRVLELQSDNIMTTANRLYISEQHSLQNEFKDATEKLCKASAVLADFTKNSHSAVRKINTWVELETNGKIKDVIAEIDPLTLMVVINAIYFKGTWDQKFSKESTSKGKFIVNKRESLNVDMMNMKKKFKFGVNSELECKVLEMPYVGKEISMFIFLPILANGLENLEHKLTIQSWQAALDDLREVPVRVILPKFVLHSSFEISSVLKELGIGNAFDTRANFSGIDGTRLLYISQVVHKAFLEVNEDGSEAAAATAVILRKKAKLHEESFVADHPFMIVIMDRRCNMILFMGRLVKPCPY